MLWLKWIANKWRLMTSIWEINENNNDREGLGSCWALDVKSSVFLWMVTLMTTKVVMKMMMTVMKVTMMTVMMMMMRMMHYRNSSSLSCFGSAISCARPRCSTEPPLQTTWKYLCQKYLCWKYFAQSFLLELFCSKCFCFNLGGIWNLYGVVLTWSFLITNKLKVDMSGFGAYGHKPFLRDLILACWRAP